MKEGDLFDQENVRSIRRAIELPVKALPRVIGRKFPAICAKERHLPGNRLGEWYRHCGDLSP